MCVVLLFPFVAVVVELMWTFNGVAWTSDAIEHRTGGRNVECSSK